MYLYPELTGMFYFIQCNIVEELYVFFIRICCSLNQFHIATLHFYVVHVQKKGVVVKKFLLEDILYYSTLYMYVWLCRAYYCYMY